MQNTNNILEQKLILYNVSIHHASITVNRPIMAELSMVLKISHGCCKFNKRSRSDRA